jgi:hypothetical protein
MSSPHGRASPGRTAANCCGQRTLGCVLLLRTHRERGDGAEVARQRAARHLPLGRNGRLHRLKIVAGHRVLLDDDILQPQLGPGAAATRGAHGVVVSAAPPGKEACG